MKLNKLISVVLIGFSLGRCSTSTHFKKEVLNEIKNIETKLDSAIFSTAKLDSTRDSLVRHWPSISRKKLAHLDNYLLELNRLRELNQQGVVQPCPIQFELKTKTNNKALTEIIYNNPKSPRMEVSLVITNQILGKIDTIVINAVKSNAQTNISKDSLLFILNCKMESIRLAKELIDKRTEQKLKVRYRAKQLNTSFYRAYRKTLLDKSK
jgi:hypothetical protein